MLHTPVATLTIHRLGRGHHHLAEGQPAADRDLVEQRGAHHIHVEEGAEIQKVILIGCKMIDRVPPLQCRLPVSPFSNIAAKELRAGWDPGFHPTGMDGRHQAIQDADSVAVSQENLHRV